MEEWLNHGMEQVEEALRCDVYYAQILQKMYDLEREYKSVVEKLTVAEQECIEDYIAVCEELEYQRVRVAYLCGRRKNSGLP